MSVNRRQDCGPAVAIMVLALAVRLAVLPFATSDGGDAASRVWAGWEWVDHPRLLTYGVWGPLHTYLVALSLWIVPDPVYAPIALSVLFSVASAGAVYWFTRIEFQDPRAALLVGLTYAVYPVAIRNGVSVRAETPFVFFMLLSMIALVQARAEAGSWRSAAAAGVALTLASMLRYEAWVLIPLFGLLLRPKPRLLAVFVACALLHPIFWSVGNWVHSGDPLYGFTAAGRWELQSMGRSQLASRILGAEATRYPGVIIAGMSLPVGLLCVAGAAIALMIRHPARVWLLPVVGVLALWGIGIARGALVPKVNYTEIAGTLLFPFSALTYRRFRIATWRPERVAVAAIVLPLVNLLFSCSPCLARVRLGWLAGPSPIPRIENQEVGLALADSLGRELQPGESLVSDHYGWGATHYVALLSRLPRRQIFLAPGAPNQQIASDTLAAFLAGHRRGVLIALSGSRFTHLLGLGPATKDAAVGPVSLHLSLMHTIGWPAGDGRGTLMVFRYSVTAGVGAGQRRERGLRR